MGILSTDTKITATRLKSVGFTKITWGSPVKIKYPDWRDKRSKRSYTKRAKLTWSKCQYCWELFDDFTDDYWKGDIIYFPAGFDAYVTPFQGNWKDPKHPANYAYITIDNRDDGWESIIPIKDLNDINLAIAVMKERIKELNKTVFGIK